MRCSPAQFSAERNSSLYPFPGRFIPRGENRRWLFPLICQSCSFRRYLCICLSFKKWNETGLFVLPGRRVLCNTLWYKKIVLQEHDSSVYRNKSGRYTINYECHWKNQFVYNLLFFTSSGKIHRLKKCYKQLFWCKKYLGRFKPVLFRQFFFFLNNNIWWYGFFIPAIRLKRLVDWLIIPKKR